MILLPPRQMELLNRGIVAVRRTTTSAYVSWRLLGTDDANVAFNFYRSTNGGAGVKLNGAPLSTTTDFTDTTLNTAASNSYYIKPVVDGVEQAASESFLLPANAPVQQYLNVPLQVPPGGTTPDGVDYTYSANDASVGDLDGDGDYEIILKWDPSNSKDNAHDGYTGNVYLDAYEFDGTRLWRIDLGRNIRAGAHYTQFLVYDFDGDGKSDLAVKTGDGTVSGTGQVIGSASADYRNSFGRILTGPEYLTVFSGQTGAAMATVPFSPARGSVSSWGDSYGNRVDRFLATVAYLDGQRPSLVMARGYYAKTMLTAYDWRDGQLRQRWTFDSTQSGNSAYAGQGNHNLTAADVDGDGKDEIVYGACTINDLGNGLYSTGLGHGDAMHVSDMVPSRPGLEVFKVNEDPGSYGANGGALWDAATGQVLAGIDGHASDVGRGAAFDIDPRYSGFEMWTSADGGIYNVDGTRIQDKPGNMFSNFGLWWDGDPLRELLDGTTISDWRITSGVGGRFNYVFAPANLASNNSTKQTPCLSGDIFGDWREEVIWRTADSSALQIWTTTIPSTMRLTTLMHDPQYRTSIAWQNVAYNQPPHTSFSLGDGMPNPPPPNIYIASPSANVTTQAENGSFGNATVFESTNAGYNYTGYVNFPLTLGFLQFNNVNAGAGGLTNIRFRYALGTAGSRTGRLIINGVGQDITFAPTGSFTTWAIHSVDVNLNAGATNTIRLESNGQDLANIDELQVDPTTAGSIWGQVFHDKNDDGVFNGIDSALAGVTVFIDANNNAALDAGEASTTTTAAGNYAFASIPPGAHQVRQIAPAQFVPVAAATVNLPSGGNSTGNSLPAARIVYAGGSGNDYYRLRRSGSGKFEILINNVPAFTIFAAAPSLTFDLGDGDDLLILDASVNGVPSPSGGVFFDGGASADTLTVVGTSAVDSVTFGVATLSLGSLSASHSAIESISYESGGGADNVSIAGGPRVTFPGSTPRLGSLTLAGGWAAVPAGAGAGTFITDTLSLHASASLDLADNDLVVNNGAFTDVQASVLAGFGNSAGGITSSTSDGTLVLALFDNAQVGSSDWNGQPIGPNAVVGKYTWFGDVNLDGQVTGDDYAVVDSNLDTDPPVGLEWLSGDANLDGIVTGDDYATIDSNLGLGQSNPAAPNAGVFADRRDHDETMTLTGNTDLLG